MLDNGFKEKEYNYTYKITNKLNGKIYIGMHSTDDMEDGYMGSCKELIKDIRIYGIENFEKEILGFYDCKVNLEKAEAALVSQDFIEREDTYNNFLGGNGGDSPARWKYRQTEKYKNHVKNVNIGTIWITNDVSENRRIREGDEIPEGFHKGLVQFTYTSLTKDSEGNVIRCRNLEYMSNSDYLRSIGKNSKWVNNGEKSFRLLEGEDLPEGFVYGRLETPNKDKKWIFNEETYKFKMIEEDEIESYLNQGWVLKSPADKTTGSKFSKRVQEQTEAKGNELLEAIRNKGIDIDNPDIPQRTKIRQITDAGLVSKAAAFNTLTRLLPQYFKKSNKTWITNGVENKKHDRNEPLPEGWKFGTTIKSGPNKNI